MAITLYCFECAMPSMLTHSQTHYVCEYCETLNPISKED